MNDNDSGDSYGGNLPPVTGGKNSGSLSNLKVRDLYVEDVNGNKVDRLHINQPAYCVMSVINDGEVKAKGTFHNRCWLFDFQFCFQKS